MYSFNSCRNTYGKEIGDKEQPLLIHRPKRTNRGLQRRRGSTGNDAPDEVCGCMHTRMTLMCVFCVGCGAGYMLSA